jgi:hypothetical protein
MAPRRPVNLVGRLPALPWRVLCLFASAKEAAKYLGRADWPRNPSRCGGADVAPVLDGLAVRWDWWLGRWDYVSVPAGLAVSRWPYLYVWDEWSAAGQRRIKLVA